MTIGTRNLRNKVLRGVVCAATAVVMTATTTSPAGAADEAAASTSTTTGMTTTAAGVVAIVGTAKAFRPARQNGSANLTVTYDCTASATPALRTHVSVCRIVTDTGVVYDDPSDVFQGEAATSTGTVTLSGSSAQICATGAGRMALDGSLQTATAPCELISLAV